MSTSSALLMSGGSVAPSHGNGSFPVSVRDGAFRDPDGRIWKYRGVTAFSALNRALNGEWSVLESYAAWTRSIGANTWRVFGIWGNIGLTSKEPSYYDALDRLLSWMAQRRLTAHFVTFTDQVSGSPILMPRADQDTHRTRVVDVLQYHDNVLDEISNEDWKNGDLSRNYGRYDGITTRSAWPDGSDPIYASDLILDWSVHHTPRDHEWPRKAKELVDISRLGVPGMPATELPAVASEPIRVANATPRQYANYLAVAEMFGGGGLLHGGFHSFDPNSGDDDLQGCIAPPQGSHAWNVGEAVGEIWRSGIIPPEAASEWEYTRGLLPNCPLVHDDAHALRTFAMLGGSRAVAVVVHHDPPNPTGPLITQNGWHVVRRVGDVFLLER